MLDIVQALIDQSDNYVARKYWNKLAQRLRDEGSEAVTNCHRLKLEAEDGKMRETDCANTEGIFRKTISYLVGKQVQQINPEKIRKLSFEKNRKIDLREFLLSIGKKI